MLTTLQIQHFTIVEALELDFDAGMSVFTGETGAGKSIMIDALELVLGAKSKTTIIREGYDACEIIAGFQVVDNPDVLHWLSEQSISIEDELLLRRVITKNGRTKCYLNGQLFPLLKIRELGLRLINIHGQHQQQHLLKHDNHRQQLDAFAGLSAQLAQVTAAYHECQRIKKELAEVGALEQQGDKRELLTYQVEELRTLALAEDELLLLSNEHKTLSQASHIKSSLHAILACLSQDEQGSASQSLHDSLQQLSALDSAEPTRTTSLELLNSALIHIDEAVSELQDWQQRAEENPERLYEIDARLSLIFDMARKHHIKPNELYDHYQTLEAELAMIEQSQERLSALHVALLEAEKHYYVQAEKLSVQRKKQAKVLGLAVSASIKQLGIPDGNVTIEFERLDGMRSHGIDRVEYFVAPNPGIAPQPLAKIGSGGELSRISLAIQVLTAEKKAYPTLIFDEVDVGIGGATAATVGQLLRRLGEHTQVFCVTHQAQVASSGNHHFLVKKQTSKGKTYSSINALSDSQKVDEIARMLGGMTITAQTKAHAEELILSQG